MRPDLPFWLSMGLCCPFVLLGCRETDTREQRCGNGIQEAAEACDGSDHAAADCVTRGFASGTLACAPDCSYDTSACVHAKRRHATYNIWLANLNGTDQQLFEAHVDSAKARGFDTMSLAVLWPFIEEDIGQFDFTWLDERLDYVAEQGMFIQLRITCSLPPTWMDASHFMRTEDGNVFEGDLFHSGIGSLADEEVRTWMERLVTQTVSHYRSRYAPGVILFYTVPFGSHMETELAFDAFVDYSPPAQEDFRQWLQDRYATVGDLNQRWGSAYAGFAQVEAPTSDNYGSPSWADWVQYRSFTMKRIFDLLAAAVHNADPHAELGVQFAGEGMWSNSGARATYDLARLVENADWVIIESIPSGTTQFAMDVVRSVAKGKRIGNEISALGMLGSPIHWHIEEALETFAYGGDLVHFANWDWSEDATGQVSFAVEDTPINYGPYLPDIDRVIDAAAEPLTVVPEPSAALYVSTMMQYMAPLCPSCPGGWPGNMMVGVDTAERVRGTYQLLSGHQIEPVAILTDYLLSSDPSVASRYADGIYLPAFNQIIADGAFAALTQAGQDGVSLFAEDSEVGTSNEFGDSRSPSLFLSYPAQCQTESRDCGCLYGSLRGGQTCHDQRWTSCVTRDYPGYAAPFCSSVAGACDSMETIDGRGPNAGPEPGQPNTLDGCADGGSPSYHSDESLDQLRIFASDGSGLIEPGAAVTIEATVFASSSFAEDFVDVYYATDPSAPVWSLIGTVPASQAGEQVLTLAHVIPEASGPHAIRGQFRRGGASSEPCNGDAWADRDDLVFDIGPCESGTTSGCTCSAGALPGVHSCRDGSWGACACYDPAMGAPVCSEAVVSCDTVSLIAGAAIGETNQPNTVDDCADGSEPASRPSVERLSVASLSGRPIAGGSPMTLGFSATAAGAGTFVDIYYSTSATNPVWQYFYSAELPSTGTTDAELVIAGIPAVAGLHALRAQVRVAGDSSLACSTAAESERDNLVFAVVLEP